MKTALGRLGWSPGAFWASTPHELWAAFDGWVEANCTKKDDEPLSDDDIFSLKDMMRRFPDGERKGKRQRVALTPAMAKELLGSGLGVRS